MAVLSACEGCGGFVPQSLAACPHCGKVERSGSALRSVAKAAVAGVTMVTLMACYGMSMPMPVEPQPAMCEDADRDGAVDCRGGASDGRPLDCEDHDPQRVPAAPDTLGDGIDQNCDGVDGTAEGAPQGAAPQGAGVTQTTPLVVPQ